MDAKATKKGEMSMIEALIGILGVLLGAGLAGIFLLIGILVVLLLIVRGLIILVRFILSGIKKNEKDKED